jgi:hypothetical protein
MQNAAINTSASGNPGSGCKGTHRQVARQPAVLLVQLGGERAQVPWPEHSPTAPVVGQAAGGPPAGPTGEVGGGVGGPAPVVDPSPSTTATSQLGPPLLVPLQSHAGPWRPTLHTPGPHSRREQAVTCTFQSTPRASRPKVGRGKHGGGGQLQQLHHATTGCTTCRTVTARVHESISDAVSPAVKDSDMSVDRADTAPPRTAPVHTQHTCM